MAYRSWHELRRRIAALQMDEAERSRRVDTLNYQIRGLERAELRPGEDEELDARRVLLRSAGRLMEAVRAAEFALSGDEDSAGACALVADAEGAVQSVASISPELGSWGASPPPCGVPPMTRRTASRDLEPDLRFLTGRAGRGGRSGWTCSTAYERSTALRWRRCWPI